MQSKLKVPFAIASLLITSILLGGNVQALQFDASFGTSFDINQNFVAGDEITDQITCISSQENATIRYIFLDSSDYFVINESTGAVSMSVDALLLPCAMSQFCNFSPTIICTGSSDSQLLQSNNPSVETALIEIDISYHQRNQFRPVFEHGALNLWVSEDTNITTHPQIALLNATDRDLGLCGQVGFTNPIRGDLKGHFQIDPVSGTLSLVSALDYESTALFSLTVQISNPMCTPQLQVDLRVTVHVIDTNDEKPVFEKHEYTMIDRYPENTQPDNIVRLRCSDSDTSADSIKYDELFTEWPFEVNADTGVVSSTRPLDFEEQASYELQFQCYDISHPDLPRDVAIVHFHVDPVNEYPPELERSSSSTFIEDTIPVGTLIASNVVGANAKVFIGARDLDEGSNHGKIQFSFPPQNDIEVINEFIRLDIDTGNITLVKSLQYLLCRDSNSGSPFLRLSLTLTVCDDPVLERSAPCPNFLIILIIQNSGDCSPSFNQSSFNIKVSESALPGFKLEEIVCNTPGDSFSSGSQLRLLTDSHEEGTFGIVNDTLVLLKSLDYEQNINYSLVIECTDTISNRHAYIPVHINVLPFNDNPPEFQQSIFVFDLSSTFDGSHTLGQIQAIDADEGYGNSISYRMSSINNASDGSQYINVNTNGVLSLELFPEELKCNKLVAFIEASDGLFSDQAVVVVNLPNQPSALVTSTETGCGIYCIAFVITLIILVVSLTFNIVILAIFVCCYRKNQRDSVSKFQESVVKTVSPLHMQNNTVHNNLQCNNASRTVTVACPIYSDLGKANDTHSNTDTNTYSYVDPSKCHIMRDPQQQLPPIPVEAPLPDLSSSHYKPLEFDEYLEMQSVLKQEKRKSDSGISRETPSSRDESLSIGSKGASLPAEYEQPSDGRERRESQAVDNIYDFIS